MKYLIYLLFPPLFLSSSLHLLSLPIMILLDKVIQSQQIMEFEYRWRCYNRTAITFII